MHKKIVLVAGGTAGHVFPMLALAEELSKKNDVFLITDLRGEKFVKQQNSNLKYFVLPISRLDLKFFFKSPLLFFLSFKFIKHADIAFFFGGYVCLFPFLSAFLLRIRKIIYQLDSHVTRLNRYLIPFANEIFYVFAQTNLLRKNAFLLGMPLRDNFEFSYIKHKKDIVIAIIGGSLGSDYWKNLIVKALDFLDEQMRRSITLKIQTKEDVSFLNSFTLKNVVTSIFFDTSILFKESHLVIARAGANTIAEIASIARPSYLVPWMNAIENHQYINAENYCKFGGAKFGNDPKELAEYIKNILDSEEYFYTLCEKASVAIPAFAKQNVASLF